MAVVFPAAREPKEMTDSSLHLDRNEENFKEQNSDSFYPATICDVNGSDKETVWSMRNINTPCYDSDVPTSTAMAMETDSVVPEHTEPCGLPDEIHSASQAVSYQDDIKDSCPNSKDHLTLLDEQPNQDNAGHVNGDTISKPEMEIRESIYSGQELLERMDGNDSPAVINSTAQGQGGICWNGDEVVVPVCHTSDNEASENLLQAVPHAHTDSFDLGVWPPMGVSIVASAHPNIDLGGDTIDFATLAHRAGVLSGFPCNPAYNAESNAKRQSEGETKAGYTNLRPILKNNQESKVSDRIVRSVHFKSPMVSVNFITDDHDDDDASTASTELLFSDEEDVNAHDGTGDQDAQINDQEVPDCVDKYEPTTKRRKTTAWCSDPPGFNFPTPITIPTLDMMTLAEEFPGKMDFVGVSKDVQDDDMHPQSGIVSTDALIGSLPSRECLDGPHSNDNHASLFQEARQEAQANALLSAGDDQSGMECLSQDYCQVPSDEHNQMTLSMNAMYHDPSHCHLDIVSPSTLQNLQDDHTRYQCIATIVTVPSDEEEALASQEPLHISRSTTGDEDAFHDCYRPTKRSIHDSSPHDTRSLDEVITDEVDNALNDLDNHMCTEEVDNAINDLDDHMCKPQTVPDSSIGITRRIEDTYGSEAHVCQSIFRLGDEALIEEVDNDDFQVPTAIRKDVLLAQNLIDDSYHATPEGCDQLSEFTFTAGAMPEHIALSPVRDLSNSWLSEDCSEQFMYYNDALEKESCSSEISDIVEGITNAVSREERKEGTEEEETINKNPLECQESTTTFRATRSKHADELLSDLQTSLEDLDGPELLQVAMHLVEGAIKKTRGLTVREKQKKVCETENTKETVSSVFLWKNRFPYHSQHALLNMNESEGAPAENEELPESEGSCEVEPTLSKPTYTRHLRLGLSRRNRVKSLHPYAANRVNIRYPSSHLANTGASSRVATSQDYDELE